MNQQAEDIMTASSSTQRIDFNSPALARKRRVRAFKDRLARWCVSIGGLAVLGAITLIFFYLGQVVLPMFQGAELTENKAHQPAWLADAGAPLLMAIEEQNQVAMRLDARGMVQFFDARNGESLSTVTLPIPAGVNIASVGEDSPGGTKVA